MDKSRSPLVTVVTPSYNQGRFLEDTICSVLEQSYPFLEYMIIDGGSTDNSVEIIRHYAHRIAYWESQPDRGQAHAINKGLLRSTGEILGWLNSDDVLAIDSVQRIVDTFINYPEIDVVYGRVLRIDVKGRLIPTPSLPKDRLEFEKSQVLGECIVNQPGCFWRRSIMEKVGLLNEDLRYVMDYEYWIRLALAGAKFKHLQEVLAYFRISSTSKTVGQTTAMAMEQLQVYEQLIRRDDLPELLGLSPKEVMRRARETRSLISVYAFYGCLKEKQWRRSAKWLLQALRFHPGIFLQRRWFDLAKARMMRNR